jgi:hypothetical protein
MSETTTRRICEAIPLVPVLLAGTYALFESTEMTTFGSIFPQFAAGATVVGSVVLIAQALIGQRRKQPSASAPSSRAWILAALLAAWALVFPIIGFEVSSLLGSAGSLAVSQDTRPTLRGLLVQSCCAAFFVFGVAYVFGTFLNVPLP